MHRFSFLPFCGICNIRPSPLLKFDAAFIAECMCDIPFVANLLPKNRRLLIFRAYCAMVVNTDAFAECVSETWRRGETTFAHEGDRDKMCRRGGDSRCRDL